MQHDRDARPSTLTERELQVVLAAASGDRAADAAAIEAVRRTTPLVPKRHRLSLGEACMAERLRRFGEDARANEGGDG